MSSSSDSSSDDENNSPRQKRPRNEEDRLVSFSKRRAGIYKKASELSILCGVQVGIIIFSPSNKPFTFGAPNIEAVVNRFKGSDEGVVDLETTAYEAQHNPQLKELNDLHNEYAARLDVARKEGARLSNIIKEEGERELFCWEIPAEELEGDEVEKVAYAMELMRSTINKQIEEQSMKIESTTGGGGEKGNSSKDADDANMMNIASSSKAQEKENE